MEISTTAPPRVRPRRPHGGDPVTTTDVDIVIPVHDEEAGLAASIERLHADLSARFPLSWSITIADNASTDGTLGIACDLADHLDRVRVLHLDRKGRGRALRAAWGSSDATVVAYMDVDLSTDLDALLPLVAPLVSGHSDVAIGTRLARGAQVVRGPRRELISRTYNAIVRSTLRTSFSDAQCGFKAVRSDVAAQLLPLVEDEGWFFDTELLVVAEHNGLRIHEVPVDWIDDPDSRVDVAATARDDLAGIARMLRRLASDRVTLPGRVGERELPLGPVDQVVRFASIGLVSTVAAAILFVLMAPAIGTVAANAAAFTICAAANAAANRRFTFALRGRAGRSRHFVGALALGLVPLVASTAALVVLDLAGVTGLVLPLLAVLVVNAVMTAVKFVALRTWVFDDRSGPHHDPDPDPDPGLDPDPAHHTSAGA
jgi:putative flippase GtrA